MCSLSNQPQFGLKYGKEFLQHAQRGKGRVRNVCTIFVRWWQGLPFTALLCRGNTEKLRLPASLRSAIDFSADTSVAGKERCGDALPAGEESAPARARADFLSEWIRRGTLLSLAMDAAQTVEWPESELKLAASSGYAFRRLVLLTVVTYCYASRVYDPKEIALQIAHDEILRFLCVGTFPTLQDIRQFTHHNQSLIQQALIRTCQLARDSGLPADPTNG
jgi:hypothetical protein